MTDVRDGRPRQREHTLDPGSVGPRITADSAWPQVQRGLLGIGTSERRLSAHQSRVQSQRQSVTECRNPSVLRARRRTLWTPILRIPMRTTATVRAVAGGSWADGSLEAIA